MTFADPAGTHGSETTPRDVERELWRLMSRLDGRLAEHERIVVEAAEAEAEYRVEFAKALLRAEGATVAEREARATLATERLLRDRKVKEAVAAASLEAQRSLREQLQAVRSVGASVRAAMEMA